MRAMHTQHTHIHDAYTQGTEKSPGGLKRLHLLFSFFSHPSGLHQVKEKKKKNTEKTLCLSGHSVCESPLQTVYTQTRTCKHVHTCTNMCAHTLTCSQTCKHAHNSSVPSPISLLRRICSNSKSSHVYQTCTYFSPINTHS